MARAASTSRAAAAQPFDRENWLMQWQTYLAQAAPLRPTGWPAELGAAPEGSICSCCRTGHFELNRSGDWFICASCHPRPGIQ